METPPQQSDVSTSGEIGSERRFRPGAIIRDVFIIFSLNFFAGLVLALTASDEERLLNSDEFQTKVGLLVLLTTIMGFMFSGVLAKQDRWRHLFVVSVIIWLVGLINVIVSQVSFISWIISFLLLEVCMGVGGALSYVFNRR